MPVHTLHSRTAIACLLASLLPLSAGAAGSEAHVHGQARLQVALEGERIDLMFSSPAANLVGFEHQPRTEQQREAVAAAVNWLETTALVTPASGHCEVVEGVVHHTHGEAQPHENHGHEDDDHHDHDHDDKGHDHGKAHREEAGEHSEFEVSQVVTCRGGTATGLATPLPERFSGIEELTVEWLSESSQGRAQLHRGERDFTVER